MGGGVEAGAGTGREGEQEISGSDNWHTLPPTSPSQIPDPRRTTAPSLNSEEREKERVGVNGTEVGREVKRENQR